ncbi:hypothetical protein LCGC14_1203740 [marine sediment metagenome]|uniref:Uncharacterized protein n=1 Tax=marine sediment metagenome TaxID=412755 RepID=A0A0F9NYK1_9ZZZZ
MFYIIGARKGYDGKEGIFNLVGNYDTEEKAMEKTLQFLDLPGIERYTSLALIDNETGIIKQLDFVRMTGAQLNIVKR